MERQTGYSIDELIALCDEKLSAGGHRACAHGHDPEPFCMIVNEIGVCAVEGDNKAKMYLAGLLSNQDPGVQRVALCYLMTAGNLDNETQAAYDLFTKNPANVFVVNAAEQAVAEHTRMN